MRTEARSARLAEKLERLERWGEARDWVGPDPYEGMNARGLRILKRRAIGRRVLIQAVKRSPLDLRRPLRIEPRPSSAAIAHVLRAGARLGRIESSLERRRTRADQLVAALERLRAEAYDQPCWGYHFDVETRFFFYPARMPNTIATAFCGLALLEAGRAWDSPRALELAEGAGEFFLEHVPQTPAGEGAYFGYLPGDTTPIHNASLLVCSLLARLAELGGREDFEQAARAGVRYAVAHQRRDGSWPYAEGAHGDWIDGFHTGYVLDALMTCADALGDTGAAEACSRGLDFYAERLLTADGAPKFFSERTHPIDGQSVAQAIRTFALASAIDGARVDLAWRVFEYAADRMVRGDGAFAFQRHRLWTNRIPHVRWVQAPMFEALAVLAEADRRDQQAARSDADGADSATVP